MINYRDTFHKREVSVISQARSWAVRKYVMRAVLPLFPITFLITFIWCVIVTYVWQVLVRSSETSSSASIPIIHFVTGNQANIMSYVNWHTKFWVELLVWSLDFDCWRNYEGINLTNFFQNKVKATVFLLSLVQRETNLYPPFHFSRIHSIWRHGNCER